MEIKNKRNKNKIEIKRKINILKDKLKNINNNKNNNKNKNKINKIKIKRRLNILNDKLNNINNKNNRVISSDVKQPTFKNVLKSISENKNGLEIGGPSHTNGTQTLYENANSFDNVVWSDDTVWCQQKQTYNFYPGKNGKVIINDSTDICSVKDKTYDFLFSCHCLEHIANPLKAVNEWLRIVKDNGFIVIVVPEKSECFDHKRQYSKFSTLLTQYENNVNEDDLSTLNDILNFHDLPMDPGAPQDPAEFKKRCLNNFYNRCLHHYVYDDNLLLEICTYFKCEYIYKITQGINRWFIMKKV